ncbi:transcriptional antiterminator, BglG [Thermoanaerobacterium xylanolyticum LX-11]|uniref:Transcriptional antiterminator, BglG n=1 Tax=Thermoanaerobacterium xylanolyticum (strain ATCC 49914 / DSM 7097 / LX-11) TaxID=858215 RepID=F6BJS4_THEXL|nr:PRD domain-containing protein [Thermoanaerobacterium xylanolyticum]AEF16981.1 transcriptional antiterminator, BglG [Thermoanaerobacterium xylanolyticum LX-11]
MKDLSDRQKFIIKSLIEKGPLSIEDLSKLMNISKRTIDREVHEANKILKSYRCVITENESKYEIHGGNESLEEISKEIGPISYGSILSQEQRQIYMTLSMLLSKEPLKSTYFSYLFNVSEGTISMYLDKIEIWLKVRNLELIRKRGIGIKVEGTEIDKRKAVIELMYSYLPLDEMLMYVYGDKQDKFITEFFNNIFSSEIINTAKKLVKLINETVVKINDDNNYFALFLHLATAIYRYMQDESIKLNKDIVDDILSSEQFSFIYKVDEIMKEHGINLTDDELAYLAIHLNGKKYIYKKEGFIELGITLDDLSKELIEEVAKILKTEIKCDDKLIYGLSQHIETLIYRLSMGLQSRNTLIDQIKKYYGELFEAVNKACRLIFSKYNITVPAEEIGYITMHVGAAIERQKSEKRLRALVICPNGIGTAKILSEKLKSAFPEIDSIEIGSIRNKDDGKDYDIIISTVKLYEDEDSLDNVITVSPFLTSDDIRKIRNLIDKIGFNEDDNYLLPLKLNDISRSESESSITKYFGETLKNLNISKISANGLNELIDVIVDEISNIDVMSDKDEIKELIKKREMMGNTVIPGTRIALLHTRSDKMIIPYIGIYRLSSPIKMRSIGFTYEEVDTILVMLARKKEDNTVLEMLGEISIALVENDDFKDALKYGNIDDVKNIIINVLKKY